MAKDKKPAGDFEMEVNLQGPRKWVVLGLLGVMAGLGFWFWWLARSESPVTSKNDPQPSTSSEPVAATNPKPNPETQAPKTRATAQEVQDFGELVALADPDQLAITQIQQYSDTELLYLTVTPTFINDSKVNQGDLAISMRDAWNKTCDCYGQLIFQSPAGQQLIHISALGEPKFKQD